MADIKFTVRVRGQTIEGVAENAALANFCSRINREFETGEDSLSVVEFRRATFEDWFDATDMLEGEPAIGLYPRAENAEKRF